jgi:hypothetical protein
VERGAGGGEVVEERLVDAEGGKCLDGGTDAFGHAFGGAAGGRGQGDARRRVAGLPCLGDEEHQHAGDGGGLAGAGAAGDEEQGVVEGGLGGLGLVVLVGKGWIKCALIRLSGTLTRAIPGARPAGGFAVQTGSPCQFVSRRREKG